MFETNKRWRVPYLLYLLAVIMLGEVAFNGERPQCRPISQAAQAKTGLGPHLMGGHLVGVSNEGLLVRKWRLLLLDWTVATASPLANRTLSYLSLLKACSRKQQVSP